MRQITMYEAKQVAALDIKVGIAVAIDELEKLGFDCKYYWDTMAAYQDSIDNIWQDNNYDEMNIETRDKLFDKLGIRDIMTKAYTEVVYDKCR